MITLDKFKKTNSIIKKLLLILTFFITFCISLNTTNATWIPRDWLVWEWLLNWNANDTSGNWNDGTETNIAYSNNWAIFNGSSSNISSPSDLWLNWNSQPFSISVTIIPTNNLNTQQIFFNYSDNWKKTYNYIEFYNWAVRFIRVRWWIDADICSYTKNINWWVSYHIVGTYDWTNLRLYINNILVNTTSSIWDGFWPIWISWFNIWSHNWWWWPYFSGNIKWVRVYNRPLSYSEIQTLYNETAPSSCYDWIKNQNETSTDYGWVCWIISRNWLVWEWLLNWNGNDTSGNWNDWTTYNITWSNETVLNQSLNWYFNGNNSYIEVADSSFIRFTDEMSYSLWRKWNDDDSILFMKRAPDLPVEYGAYLWGPTDFRIFQWISPSYINSYYLWTDIDYYKMQDWNYHHLVFTHKFWITNSKAYLDWQEIQLNWTNQLELAPWGNYPLYIWKNWTLANSFPNWNMQAIKFYNRILSSTEIQSLYNEWVVLLNWSSSWRRSCWEQKASTHYGVSIVNIKWKNGIKLTWQNPDWAVKTIISKNLIEDINLDITKTEYIDYNIELWKKYTYYIKSTNSCWNVWVTEKIEITYDNNPVFAMSDLNNSNNSLSFFIAKYWDFWASNLRVSWYLTSGSWTVNKFLPRVNELYNFWYLKQWAYNLKVQIEDSNWNIYKNYTVEKDIYVTSASTSSIDLQLSAEDSWPDYINYKYSITTKSFDFKNTVATVAILDAISKKIIKENSITLNSDSNNLTNNSFTYKEWYLEPNTLHKRVIRFTIWESWDPIYSDIYDFKVWDLKWFSLDYDDKNKIFSWNKANLTNIVYSFQCKSTDWWADIFKQIKNSLKYKDDTINKIENWNYVCSVSYFKDWYVYKSSEKWFWENMRMTKNTAYKSFMDIYSNWTAVNYDKKALKLWIINDVSEKNNPIKWIEYAKLLFKVYWELTFDQKKYDKSSYDEFSKLLTNMIWIVDVDVMKWEFDDLKVYLKDNNDRFKTRVQNVFNYKDEIVEFINSWKSEDSKAILKNRIANYFFISK